MKRRLFLTAALSTAALPACANAPPTSARPIAKPADALALAATDADRLVERAGLGGRVTFTVSDAATGTALETYNPIRPLPPASTEKAVTSLYALETLGSDFRFETRLVATGPITGGILDGDLVLLGGGDPALDSDGLYDLAAQANAAGLREVRGRLLVDGSALPAIDRIAADQPDHVGYNPAIGGLNLNFNRVYFSWERSGGAYSTVMDARTERYRPAVATSRMSVADRSLPVYTYARRGEVDDWTVARGQLGGSGSRWLPVRNPDLYAGDVLRTMLRAHGITAPAPQRGRGAGAVIAVGRSASLDRMVASMLRYSTNIVAEVVGMAASARRAGAMPRSLGASAGMMADWMAVRSGGRRPDFDDHSGLHATARLSSSDMVGLLTAEGAMARLRPLMRELTLEGPPRQPVRAKTGTLNFVSGLAGYFDARSGRSLAFATFVADTDRRAGLPLAERESPPGGRPWLQAARSLQFDLIERWAVVHA